MSTPPVIDFSPFMVEDGAVVGKLMTKAQEAVVRELDAVNRGSGFAYLQNIGISSEDLQEWFLASRELFALPEEEKMRELQRATATTNIGYVPMGQENLNASRPAELKESFKVRCPSTDNLGGCPRSFVAAASALWAKAGAAMGRYALACALALGVEPDFLTRHLQAMDQVRLSFLHYPPCAYDPGAADGGGPIRIGEHTDFGLFTLLFLDGPAEGLEVKKVAGGEVGGAAGGGAGAWAPVRGLGGSTLLVNTGALFARWTNDRYRATAHRVVVPSLAAASAHRYSIACFCNPDADTEVVVDPRFLAPGEEAKHPPITAGEYVLARLRRANAKACQSTPSPREANRTTPLALRHTEACVEAPA